MQRQGTNNLDTIFTGKTAPLAAGMGPGNTVQLEPETYMLAGDVLLLDDTDGAGTGGTVSFFGLLQPL